MPDNTNKEPKLSAREINANKWKEAQQQAQIKFDKTTDPNKAALQAGSGRTFSAKNAGIDKYLTYGTKVYGKLGFDPTRDNLELYNEETKDYGIFQKGSDINRAWDGMWKLAKVGFQDTIGAGLFSDKNGHEDFSKIMSDYSSVRKSGSSAFWANTMLSSGYTAGIIGAIAAEELAMAVGTIATEGAMGGAAAARTAFNITRLGKAFSKTDDVLRAVDALHDINNIRKWYHPAELGKKAATALNPLENTVDFIKTLDKVKDAGALKQISLGAGSLYRDFRKISMTHGESKLEANMAKKEVRDGMIAEWYKQNPGKDLEGVDLAKIEEKSNNVYADTYHANLGLIYATNAITFDNLFKSGKYAQKWMSNNTIGTLAAEGIGTNAARVNVVSGFWKQAGRKMLSSVHPKSIARIAAGNLMEGVQEYGQDALSGAAKTHNLNAKDVSEKLAKEWNLQAEATKQTTGGYWNYFSKDLVNALGNNYGSQGLSTFLSGAFMGGFAAPMGWANQAITHVTVGGGAQKGFQWAFNNKKFQEEKASRYKQAEAEAKILTDFFNNTGADYIKHATNPLFEQTDLQEKMLEAINAGDKKALEDMRHQSFALGVQTLMKRGMENDLIKHLESGANELSSKELGEFLGRTDITDDNATEHRQKLLEKANTIREFKRKFDEINDTIINPVNPSKLSKDDPGYMNKMIQYHTFENFKKELLFTHGAISDKGKRMSELVDQLQKGSNISSLEIQALTNESDLKSQIDLLKLEVQNNKDLQLDADGKKRQKDAIEKLNIFESYRDLQTELNNLSEYDYARRESIKKQMQNVYHRLAVVNDNQGVQHIGKSRMLADKLFDYNEIGRDSKALQKYVNTMLDPTSVTAHLEERAALLKQFNDNKEIHIAESLKAFHRKAETSMMLKILQEKGIFFELSELDKLLKKQVMPSKIYDLETGKLASPEQVKEAQDVLKHYFKKLTGLTATEQHEDIYREAGGRFDVNDKDQRTYSDLAKEYGFDKRDTLPAKDVLKKILKSKTASQDEKALAEILLQFTPEDATISFTDTAERPNSYSSENGSVVDARYSASNFTNSFISLEESILKNEMQRLVEDHLESDEEFNNSITELREQVTEYLELEKEKDEADQKIKRFEWKGLDNNADFIKEAFVNKSFQGMLISMRSSGNTKTTWSKLIDVINNILSKYKVDSSKSVYAEVVSLVQQKVDYSELAQPEEDNTLTEEDNIDEEDFAEEQPISEEEQVAEQEPVEEIEVEEFDRNASIESFPKGLLEKLISKYKEDVKKGDFSGKNLDKLSVDTLTKEFKTWVDDYGQKIIDSYEKIYQDKMPENIEIIPDENKAVLAGLGYTEEQVNDMSEEEIANILESETTNVEGEQAIENEVIDELIDEELTIEPLSVAEQISSAFEELAKSAGEAAAAKMQQYADRINAGEEKEKVLEGLPKSFVDGVNKLLSNNTQNEESNQEEEVNTDGTGTPTSDTNGGESNQEKTGTQEKPGINKAIHTAVVNRLQKGEEVIAEITGRTGVTSIRATLDTGESILFYDHNNEVKASDKGELVTFKLVPEMTLEDGRVLTNVVEAYIGDRFMGNLAETDYKKTPRTISVNATETEIQEAAAEIVANNEKLFTEKQLIKQMLKDLGYSKSDIKKLKKGQRMKILKNQWTKEQYMQRKLDKLKRKIQQPNTLKTDVTKFLEGKFEGISTEEELLNVFGEVINKFPNYNDELEFIKNIFNQTRNVLANQKDFSKLKVGGKLLLANGKVVKITAVNDKSIEVVDFNSIIENKTTIDQSSFNNKVSKVINDFNKSDKDVSSRLDENNIEQLSSIFSKFTTSAFSVSDTNIADDEMLENFKACK